MNYWKTCTKMTSWKIVGENAFKKQYKNMGHTRQTEVDKAIRELVSSENPANIGNYKQHQKIFAYELGKSDRLIYTLDYFHNEIILIRVCDHKSVYGKD